MANIFDQVVDWTPLLSLETRIPGVIGSLDLFETPDMHATDLVMVPRETNDSLVIPARLRNGERNWVTSNRPEEVPFRIPFFPLDHNVKPVDVQSYRALQAGNTQVLETVAQEVSRYTNRIQRSIDATKEMIWTSAILGTAFVGSTGASNSNYNYYTAFGQTQQVVTVDFTDDTVDPTAVINAQARSWIAANKKDGTSQTKIIALCGAEFFSNITSNAFTKQAYLYYQGSPNILRDRISGDADFQVFDFGGIIYIEVDTPQIATDEAYVLPMGIPGMFQQHYAPADTIAAANKPALDQYLFMFEDFRTVRLQSEFALLAVNTRPELVVKVVTA